MQVNIINDVINTINEINFCRQYSQCELCKFKSSCDGKYNSAIKLAEEF